MVYLSDKWPPAEGSGDVVLALFCWKFYNNYRDKYTILYYFYIAQNTVINTVSDFFTGVCICLYMNVHIFTVFLFVGLIPV